MGLRAAAINGGIGFLFRLLCDVDDRELKTIPASGPAVLIANHTSNLEAPLLYVRLRPRATIGLGKAELWKFGITRMMMKAWGAIPVKRGRLDRAALTRSSGVLERGDFLCLAPEGRRSRDGTLQRGLPGAIWFAAESGVPIYPIAQWGCRGLLGRLLRFQRPQVAIRVGRPFRVKASPARTELQAVTDEMMAQLAALMPESMRGYYSNIDPTTRYLEML